MERLQQQAPSFESVWAILQENAQQMKESEEKREESRADFDRRMKESRADFDRRMKESEEKREKSNADYEKRMRKLEELTGSWANNHGSFAEEYFFNSFENGKQNFFGEKFDDIAKNLKNFWQGLEDQYDIVLYNHSSVAIIEVKYKAHKNDVEKVLKKAATFRILFPNYKDFKIYLGLASMSFYPELEQECIDQGVVIIKQVGDTVMINDGHLKVF
jgi:broad specificity phosphatase PhoE